jgi:N-glycosylase/DNA lyase
MPTINLSSYQQFSLDRTLGCGQVFRWDQTEDGWWYGVVNGRVIRIRQEGRQIIYHGAPGSFIKNYFSLNLDLISILASIDHDPVIHTAINRNSGLRIIRQPRWECLISYICSTNSNIPTIRRRIASIAEQFGEPIDFEGETYFTFPEPSSISSGELEDLEPCRLGYRKPYIFGTSCSVTDEKCWDEMIEKLPYEDARKELIKLNGVGPKAADCILLFAFQKYESFPVDVWIRRIMRENYLPGLLKNAPLTMRDYDTIRNFARNHFGMYCGYAQEYLYAARKD